jgi:hypothetical protein
MEAELAALERSTIESEWLRELLMDLHVVEKHISIILLNCDNQTIIVKVNNFKGKCELIKTCKETFQVYQKIAKC